MISRLADTLHAAGLELDAREIAEILWLAPLLDSSPARAEPIRSSDTSGPPLLPPPLKAETPEVGPLEEPPPSPLPSPPPLPRPSHPMPDVEVVMPRREQGLPVRRGGGMAFRSPGAPALPNALQLGRALRPLRRRHSSPRQRELDEVATAERVAREGLWLPVMRPGRSRWLELELVLDTGRSMALWTQTLAELRTFFRYNGAFRDVRTWSLVTDGEEGRARLYRGAVGAAQGAPERDPRELLGTPAERRLILVVSDCVSPAWHKGGVGELLRSWGRGGPVALLQMLPQRVWVRTALKHLPVVWLHGRAPGESNARLVFGRWPGARVPNPRGLMSVPTLTLERDSFASWAQVVAGRAGAWAPGVVLREGGTAREGRATEEGAPLERVRRFDAMASPLAQRLVRLFAAVPLSLPVMRLVWRTRLPEAGQVHLAEVFLGGLLEEVASPGGSEEPEKVQYDFVPGVREVLLESLPWAESIDVLESVSHYIEERLGQTLDFQAMLADPTAFGGQVDEALRPFARVAAAVLRPLGGEYAELATRLEGLPPGQALTSVRARKEDPSHEPPPEPARPETPAEQPPTVSSWKASGKRVLVMGSREEVSEDTQRLCFLLGEELARKGHSLVGRGTSGVDEAVGAAYLVALREQGGEPHQHFIQVVSEGGRPPLPGGRLEPVQGSEVVSACMAHADVVIVLGTERDSSLDFFEAFQAARAARKLFLPLQGTGLSAEQLHEDLRGNASSRLRMGVSQRSLRRLSMHPGTHEAAEHAVQELLLLIERFQPGAESAPYARAMLELLQAVAPALFSDEGEAAEFMGWREFVARLSSMPGMRLVEPRPRAPVNGGDPGPALQSLRATLPGMVEHLLEHFEQISTLEAHALFGWKVQAALAPLLLEFARRDALEAIGELLSSSQAPREGEFVVSLAEAVRQKLDSPEQYEAWLSTYTKISSQELEFRKAFLAVAERLNGEYEALRRRDQDAVEAALLAILRQSGLVPEGTSPEPRFVRYFLSQQSSPQRATAYLLIQRQGLTELLPEVKRSIPSVRSSLASKPRGWSFAVSRLIACLLHRHAELVGQEDWLDVRDELVKLLGQLRAGSLSSEELALWQLQERLSVVLADARRPAQGAQRGVPRIQAEPREAAPSYPPRRDRWEITFDDFPHDWPREDVRPAMVDSKRDRLALQNERDSLVRQNERGEALQARGDLPGALECYRAALSITQRIIAQSVRTPEWQRELSLRHDKIGEVLQAQGDLQGALESYRSSLAIARHFVEKAPTSTSSIRWSRDFSITSNWIGDILRGQGKLQEALAAYQSAFAVRKSLVELHPRDFELQRDLCVSHTKMGEVLRAQGQLQEARTAFLSALALAKGLAAHDPRNIEWQDDLATIHGHMGEVLRAQGQLQNALQAYESALAIREFLVDVEPQNEEWRRERSLCREKVADVLRALKQSP